MTGLPDLVRHMSHIFVTPFDRMIRTTQCTQKTLTSLLQSSMVLEYTKNVFTNYMSISHVHIFPFLVQILTRISRRRVSLIFFRYLK